MYVEDTEQLELIFFGLVRIINKADWWELLEFILAKDTIDKIIQLPIYVQIKRSDWDKWELACSKNMSLWPKQDNVYSFKESRKRSLGYFRW